MRTVIIESPFRARDGHYSQFQARLYLTHCIRDTIYRNESPYASHAIIPGALNDDLPEERDKGIRAGYSWWKYADLIVFYTDLGWSEGMRRALHRAKTMHVKWEERQIGWRIGCK